MPQYYLFRFPVQDDQAFHPFGLDELVSGLSGKDNALTYRRLATAGHLIGQISIQIQCHVMVKCAAHPKKELTSVVVYPLLVFFRYNGVAKYRS